MAYETGLPTRKQMDELKTYGYSPTVQSVRNLTHHGAERMLEDYKMSERREPKIDTREELEIISEAYNPITGKTMLRGNEFIKPNRTLESGHHYFSPGDFCVYNGTTPAFVISVNEEYKVTSLAYITGSTLLDMETHVLTLKDNPEIEDSCWPMTDKNRAEMQRVFQAGEDLNTNLEDLNEAFDTIIDIQIENTDEFIDIVNEASGYVRDAVITLTRYIKNEGNIDE